MEEAREFTDSELARAIAEKYPKHTNWGGHTEHGYTHYEVVTGGEVSLPTSKPK